ncbi:hypothetical protein EPN44_05160 [bacterium]|nr:MAG: hypothetical protein EPN44_05160 [bacterium]
MRHPPPIRQGAVRAYFVFDVADTIDLQRLGRIAGEGVERAPLQLRSVPSPAYIQFPTPPLAARLPSTRVLGLPTLVRAKIFDYGVLSIRLSLPYEGSWVGFAELANRVRQSEEPVAVARRLLDEVLREIGGALDEPHEHLVEDYFVYEVEAFESAVDAAALLDVYGPALAGLLCGETQPLGEEEQREALRVRFSYFPSDVAVIQWDAAFIFDTREGAEAIADILEFANTQLVELRTYDTRLDGELDEIYALDISRAHPARLLGRRRAADQRAARLRYLLVDIRELADRASNALKIIGDAFYARLYRGIAGRLSLVEWQRQIDSKLASINEVYRFLTDQGQNARGEFLEVVIIVLIAVELVIALFGLRR